METREIMIGVAGVAVGVLGLHLIDNKVGQEPVSQATATTEAPFATNPGAAPELPAINAGVNALPAPITVAQPTFVVEYPLSHIACLSIMQDVVVDSVADSITVNGVTTYSSLKTMSRVTGDNSYRHILPSTRAEDFARDVMAKSDPVVPVLDINNTPPGTQFDFGVNCVDETRPNGSGGYLPLNLAFPEG